MARAPIPIIVPSLLSINNELQRGRDNQLQEKRVEKKERRVQGMQIVYNERRFNYNQYNYMQEESSEWPTRLLHLIINSSHLSIIHSIVSFLGREELQPIATLALQQKRQQFFYQLVIANNFVNSYLNRLDRTNYYLFYDHPSFNAIERQNLRSLVAGSYNQLVQHHHCFLKLEADLQAATEGLQGQQELISIINSIFFQTDLALPKMKRETIGMHCESALQDFLAMLKFPDEDIEEPWTQQCIVQLKQQTSSELQQLISHFPYFHQPPSHPAATAHQKIRIVRFCGFKITPNNWKDFLIEGFRMHNLIVISLAICSQLVASYSILIERIEDPFLRLVEFSLRANIYRNLILNFEEKLGFLFGSYSQFYENVYSPPPDRPPFRFWLPAFSIWLQTMKSFHLPNQRIFNYIAAKMREESLLQFLKVRTQKLPSFFSGLQGQVQMRMFSESRKLDVYGESGSGIELECFFQSNLELYQILVKDYLEYMVDVSVNQFSVHRCGHSRHQISNHPLFASFHYSFAQESLRFYQFVKEILFSSAPQELRLGFFKQTVKDDITFIEQKLAKPVTIREILERVNGIMVEEVEKMPEFAVFEEEGIGKYRIIWDFEEKDTLLDYFCGKYKIGQCPERLQFYYNCQMESSDQVEESDCEGSLQNCEQYISDEQMEDEEGG